MEVKNKYAYVITQDICNKFIELFFFCEMYGLSAKSSVSRLNIFWIINKISFETSKWKAWQFMTSWILVLVATKNNTNHKYTIYQKYIFEIHLWSYFIVILTTHLFQILFAQSRLYFHELSNFQFLLFFRKFLWLKLRLMFGYNLYETESIFMFVNDF